MPNANELVSRYATQIQGKVVITTGISPGGLGAFFVQTIAKGGPAWIILAGRDEKKAQQTEAAIKEANGSVKTRFLHLDLGSLKAVREAAETVKGWSDIPVIDVLVNNAATLPVEYKVTADGFEEQLATNHLGHFLFTNLIIDKILASSSPRVVNVSSQGHRISPFRFGDYNFDVSFIRLFISLSCNQCFSSLRVVNSTPKCAAMASPKPQIYCFLFL